jgi:hypothetical protein
MLVSRNRTDSLSHNQAKQGCSYRKVVVSHEKDMSFYFLRGFDPATHNGTKSTVPIIAINHNIRQYDPLWTPRVSNTFGFSEHNPCLGVGSRQEGWNFY